MTITSQGAERIAAAIQSITPGQTVEQLLQSASELSAASLTPDTLLYSGSLDPSIKAYEAAGGITGQLSASVLADTERGAFLNSGEFNTAFDVAVLQSSVYQQSVASGQKSLAAITMAEGSYLYNSGGDSAFARHHASSLQARPARPRP